MFMVRLKLRIDVASLSGNSGFNAATTTVEYGQSNMTENVVAHIPSSTEAALR